MPTHTSPVFFEHDAVMREPLLNWSIYETPGSTVSFQGLAKIGSTLSGGYRQGVVAIGVDNLTFYASYDHGKTWEAGLANGDGFTATDWHAGVDLSKTNNFIVMMNSANGKVYYSADAGASWSSAVSLPSTSNWNRIRRSWEFNTVIATGTNKIATSSGSGGYPISFSSQTVPGAWSTRVPGRLFQPAPGTTGHGLVMVAADGSDKRRVCYSLNATTWVETGVHATTDGNVAWITWSEYYQAWFALTVSGYVYSTPSLSTAWTKVATLYTAGSPVYWWMEAFGPYFVIHGENVGASASLKKTGNFVVTDLVSKHNVFQEGASSDVWASEVTRCDGQLVASQIFGGSPFGISLVWSRRTSWVP